jgi:hypothetical protein
MELEVIDTGIIVENREELEQHSFYKMLSFIYSTPNVHCQNNRMDRAWMDNNGTFWFREFGAMNPIPYIPVENKSFVDTLWHWTV